jgi:hypothetical protein
VEVYIQPTIIPPLIFYSSEHEIGLVEVVEVVEV